MNPPAIPNNGPGYPIVLYDGACGLCTRSVRFILAHEAGASLRFAAQTSPIAGELLQRYNASAHLGKGVILIENGRCWVGSTAALRVCRYLTAPWRYGAGLLIIPAPIRDGVYRLVARNRRRLFPAAQACVRPPGAVAGRFLDIHDSFMMLP